MDQDRPGFAPPPSSSPDEPILASPAPEVLEDGGRRRRISAGVVVAAVGIGALGVAGAAYAAAADPSPSPSGSSTVPGYGLDRDGDGDHGGPGLPGGVTGEAPLGTRPSGAPDGHGMRGGMGMRGPGMGIHGTFVVPKTGGGYQTVQMQRGSVTAVSSTSITVTSEDGFSATYDVTSTTVVNRGGAIADITVGADVVVVGVQGTSGVTAERIGDLALMGKGMGDRDGDGPAGTAPSGTASPGSTA